MEGAEDIPEGGCHFLVLYSGDEGAEDVERRSCAFLKRNWRRWLGSATVSLSMRRAEEDIQGEEYAFCNGIIAACGMYGLFLERHEIKDHGSGIRELIGKSTIFRFHGLQNPRLAIELLPEFFGEYRVPCL